MGKLAKNHLARLLTLTAAMCKFILCANLPVSNPIRSGSLRSSLMREHGGMWSVVCDVWSVVLQTRSRS